MSLSLFSTMPTPLPVEGVDLRCSDVAALLGEVRGASVVYADPPWTYRHCASQGTAQEQYDGLTEAQIAAHIAMAFDCAAPDAYLICWVTWPKLMDWLQASQGSPWEYLSGGSWHKTTGLGVGFHWRGDSEPLLMYRKGKPHSIGTLRNAHGSPRERHSEKPTDWLREIVQCLCPPDGQVFDLYAGLGTMARACSAEGRRYIGAEIDPERHAQALAMLARFRSMGGAP